MKLFLGYLGFGLPLKDVQQNFVGIKEILSDSCTLWIPQIDLWQWNNLNSYYGVVSAMKIQYCILLNLIFQRQCSDYRDFITIIELCNLQIVVMSTGEN